MQLALQPRLVAYNCLLRPFHCRLIVTVPSVLALPSAANIYFAQHGVFNRSHVQHVFGSANEAILQTTPYGALCGKWLPLCNVGSFAAVVLGPGGYRFSFC